MQFLLNILHTDRSYSIKFLGSKMLSAWNAWNKSNGMLMYVKHWFYWDEKSRVVVVQCSSMSNRLKCLTYEIQMWIKCMYVCKELNTDTISSSHSVRLSLWNWWVSASLITSNKISDVCNWTARHEWTVNLKKCFDSSLCVSFSLASRVVSTLVFTIIQLTIR